MAVLDFSLALKEKSFSNKCMYYVHTFFNLYKYTAFRCTKSVLTYFLLMRFLVSAPNRGCSSMGAPCWERTQEALILVLMQDAAVTIKQHQGVKLMQPAVVLVTEVCGWHHSPMIFITQSSLWRGKSTSTYYTSMSSLIAQHAPFCAIGKLNAPGTVTCVMCLLPMPSTTFSHKENNWALKVQLMTYFIRRSCWNR